MRVVLGGADFARSRWLIWAWDDKLDNFGEFMGKGGLRKRSM